jgi:LPXTG-site transpeptidase (sortase) family protein
MTQRTHTRLNDILTAIVVAGALYMAFIPLWPQLSWKLDTAAPAPFGGRLSRVVGSDEKGPNPTDNRIVIPSAKINEPILEGKSLSVIDDGGSWRKNINTNNPKEAGNTVIVGHRFTFRDPEGAFYHLDKVSVGDYLAVYWQGEELLYKVSETRVVEATALEVEDNTTERKLTLYTCTPLVTASHRLVITALPEQEI